MSDLAFLDTETTGLDADDEVWELAIVRRAPDGQQVAYHMFIEHDRARADRLPDRFRRDYLMRYDPAAAIPKDIAAARLRYALVGKPHVVGAMPWFDTGHVTRLLAASGYRPGWHYHLIDVESMMLGFLAARGVRVEMPWTSDALSELVGVSADRPDRHTAMGDVCWAIEVYDTIHRDLPPLA